MGWQRGGGGWGTHLELVCNRSSRDLQRHTTKYKPSVVEASCQSPPSGDPATHLDGCPAKADEEWKLTPTPHTGPTHGHAPVTTKPARHPSSAVLSVLAPPELAISAAAWLRTCVAPPERRRPSPRKGSARHPDTTQHNPDRRQHAPHLRGQTQTDATILQLLAMASSSSSWRRTCPSWLKMLKDARPPPELMP